jgi:MHS family proline/betaine transporter-like MFS transporter
MAQSLAVSAEPRGSLARTVIAGAVGNVLEWYDFGLFGFFAPTIAHQFFPREDGLAALMGTFGVFATGFLMRPLGGLVFGHIGDRVGRKRALELSVLLMAVSTTVLGLLPTYATIGVWAPLLLTVIRLFQGLSIGGEYVGSMSFLTEHAPPGRRGFIGSWSGTSVVLGSLLGSGTAALCTGLLSESQLASWGWRIPFLAGLLLGALGFWLRIGVAESPHFLHAQRSGGLAENPIAEALRRDGRAILTTLGLTGLSSVGFYLPFVWMATWLSQINHPPLPEGQALTASTIALLALLLLTPLSALISDRVGRRPMFLASAIGFALFTDPIFRLLSAGTFPAAVLGGLAFAAINGLFAGSMAATMVELFPTRTRYTGIAIGYNVGQALLGGTAALVATALIQFTGNNLAPAWYLTACAIVAGLASLFIPARHDRPLDAPPRESPSKHAEPIAAPSG